MKYFFLLSILFSGQVYAQAIFTLNCVESSDINNQFVLNVDEAKNRVYLGNINYSNVSITKEIISFSVGNTGSIYTTEIIRSTGRFRVSFNSKYSFGGSCSRVTSNKF